VAATRRAAAPSSLWLAGLAFPTLGLGLSIGWELALRTTPTPTSVFERFSLGAVLILFPPLMRLAAGLARECAQHRWQQSLLLGRRPNLASVWESGRGLMGASFGLWLQMTFFLALVVGIGHSFFDGFVDQGTNFDVLAYVVGGPLLCLALAYALTLSVLYQLALQSLAQNRRGVVSALQHGWRLIRNDPRAAIRVVVFDALVSLPVIVFVRIQPTLGDQLGVLPAGATALLAVMLLAILGVTRAGYWASCYRKLGGLAPDDGVPGLNLPELPRP
jgi:hypothetical protein